MTPIPTANSALHSAVHPTLLHMNSSSGASLHTRPDSFQCASELTVGTRPTSANSTVSRSSLDDVTSLEALRPEQRNQEDMEFINNPFAFSPGELDKMQNPKSLAAFADLGGLPGLEKGLRTNLQSGLSIDETVLDGRVTCDEATEPSSGQDLRPEISPWNGAKMISHHAGDQFSDRRRIYGDNRLPEKRPPSIFALIWRAYNDRVLILLTIAAVISLSLGLYETFSGGSDIDWIEGVAICAAIILVVTVGAAIDWQKERQFMKLNKRKDDREVKAVRSGKSIQISVFDVAVGDVLHLESGDVCPVDGVLISGHGVRCDESSATGESDQIKKVSGSEVDRRIRNGATGDRLDPFIISGSTILEGVGTYLVTGVGTNSSHGKILMGLQTESEDTPLQVKLGRLANWIGGLGSSAAVLLLVILTIRFITGLQDDERSGAVKGQQFLDILIVAITVVVVAVPEGLPLAVTLALAFATTRMLKENNLVRVLCACETMGNATTICSDKTGTLTQNKMTVVAGAWGVGEKFANSGHSRDRDEKTSSFPAMFDKISKDAQDLLRQSMTLNSTAFEADENGVPTFIGSKTETALLILAKEHLGLQNLAEARANSAIVQLFPFDSGRKCMGAVVRLGNDSYRLLVKGAAEMMLARATHAVSNIYGGDLESEEIGPDARGEVCAQIEEYAQQSLRAIGMISKDFTQWPPAKAKCCEEDSRMADFDDVSRDMTWIGVVGIHDPLREGVVDAVAQCQRSGVVVRMVTGDNITTAKAIATDCGIMTPGAIAMEGCDFRQLDDDAMDQVLSDLRVLARSSPEDKRILVSRLKRRGETVAVTGDGTNDAPALKAADVGFSMGIAGTEIAKEASSIILLDDNFSSTITALMWGRAVNDAVQRFLQFQITVNVTAVVLTFISAISHPDYHSVLTAVQLLWVNLIMDTLAALALATDAPTAKILDRPPQPKCEPLITINMWKMILGQAVYQLAVALLLYFAGCQMLGYDHNDKDQVNQLATMVFNAFVWMQIFNELNNRRLDNQLNIFEGIHRNYWFLGVNCIMVGGQVMIIFVGGQAFNVVRINGAQWAICLLCALPCLLWGVLIRFIPDEWFDAVFTATVTATASVLLPVIDTFGVVFRPIAEGWHVIIVAPTKRVAQRVTAKLHKSTTDDEKYREGRDKAQADEEALTALSAENRATSVPICPPPDFPPIILTTPH